MDIRLNANPGMRAAYLANQIAAGKTKKATSKSNLSRSQDTVVLSKEARAAYSSEQTKKTQSPPETKNDTSGEESESVRVNGIMMKDGKWDDSETTFSNIIDELTNIQDAVKAQGGTLIGTQFSQTLMMAVQATRDQISQSVQNLLNKNGIIIPEGQSFTMDVKFDDFYIHVNGLDDPELTEAVEKAINVGNNGYYLWCHMKDCRSLTNQFGFTVPSTTESLSEAKESLYYMVQDLTGYDIRTLPREDGHIFTPDGQDLWDVLLEKASQYPTPDGIMSIDISQYLAIYQRIAQLGWDSVPDPVYQLLYQDGGLYDIGTDYGFGPGQTGWQDWAHEHAAELSAKIIAGVDQQIANHTSRTYAAPHTTSVPKKTAETNETEKEPDQTEKPEESEEIDESTWKGPWTIPVYGKRKPLILELEKLRLADGVLLTEKVQLPKRA